MEDWRAAGATIMAMRVLIEHQTRMAPPEMNRSSINTVKARKDAHL